MTNPQNLCPDRVDDLLSAVARHHNRTILSHLRKTVDSTASIDDLITPLRREHGMDDQTAKLHLYHESIPALEDRDLIAYDSRTETIRYHGHPVVEEWLSVITQNEPPETYP